MMDLESAAVEKDESGNNIVEEFDGLKAAKIDSPSHNINQLQQPLIPTDNEDTIQLKTTSDIGTSPTIENSNSQTQPKPKVEDNPPKSACCILM